MAVDEAGKRLADFVYPEYKGYDDPNDWMTDYSAALLDLDGVLEVVNNWRSSHSFPLNTFQVTLKKGTRGGCEVSGSAAHQKVVIY